MTEPVNIFGQLDVDEIPDNPFWIEEGQYDAIITAAYYQQKRDSDQQQLIIVYTINDEASKYHGKDARDRFNVHPELTKEYFRTLTGKEQAQIENDLSAVKRRLFGSESWNPPQTGLGLDPKAPIVLEDLIGREVELVITNGGEQNQYVNVRSANLRE